MSISKLKIIAIFVLVIFLVISIEKCRENNEKYQDRENYISSLNDSIKILANNIAETNVNVVNQELFTQIINERNELKKILAEQKIKAKNVKTFTQVVTETKIDTLTITLHDSIPCLQDTQKIIFAVFNKDYEIGGFVGKKNIEIEKILFPDTLSVVAWTEKSFFKDDKILVSVKHSNPFIATKKMQSFMVREKKKWYEKGWVKIVGIICVGGGLGILSK